MHSKDRVLAPNIGVQGSYFQEEEKEKEYPTIIFKYLWQARYTYIRNSYRSHYCNCSC